MGRDHLGDVSKDERTVLKWILEKLDMRFLAEFNWRVFVNMAINFLIP
jgi:hypothetical protein